MNKYLIEKREVTKIIKNQYGEVVALCNDVELWSPKLRSIAIPEIELNINKYFIKKDEREFEIKVLSINGFKKILIVDPDKSKTDFLLELPDCD